MSVDAQVSEKIEANVAFHDLLDRAEKRIQEIATFQYPAKEMEAWTIRKDFRERTDPQAYFHYEDLPEIKL